MFERNLGLIAPAAIIFTLLVNLPAFAGTSPRILESSETRAIEVTSDSAIVIESGEPFSELSIANPAVADISTISGTTLYVLGKRPGRTTLMLMDDSGRVMSILDVRVTPDVTELQRRLAEVLPGEEIDVLTAKDGLVLSGTVSGPEMIDRALELANHYAPGKISNLLTIRSAEPVSAPVATVTEEAVAMDPSEIEVHLRRILPHEEIDVYLLGDALVLSGDVSSQDHALQALKIAQLVAGETKITNLMSVAEERRCVVRTRRAGELIQSDIPCRSNAKYDAGETDSADELDTASISPLAPATSPIPLPRPLRS